VQGGTSIEDLAEKYPDKIVKIPIDIRTGITDAEAMQVRWLVEVATEVEVERLQDALQEAVPG
jgi:succinyl-CoA synthetase beta subunit